MAEENVEIVRGIFQGWTSGDFGTAATVFDPHVVFVVRPPFPDEGVFLGLDGMGDYMRRFLEQWERFTVEADSLRAVGDTVLAHAVQHAAGKASGVAGEVRYFMLFTFRGGRIVRMESMLHEAEALEAVGLRE